MLHLHNRSTLSTLAHQPKNLIYMQRIQRSHPMVMQKFDVVVTRKAILRAKKSHRVIGYSVSVKQPTGIQISARFS